MFCIRARHYITNSLLMLMLKHRIVVKHRRRSPEAEGEVNHENKQQSRIDNLSLHSKVWNFSFVCLTYPLSRNTFTALHMGLSSGSNFVFMLLRFPFVCSQILNSHFITTLTVFRRNVTNSRINLGDLDSLKYIKFGVCDDDPEL